jgi:ATP-dependent RNA helicase DeaD
MDKIMGFEDLGLSKRILKAVKSKGFEEPSLIQIETIPVMLRDDTDIIAQAQTGTGKTAAFGLPLLDMLDIDDSRVQALILVPTRELAIQVSEEINSLKGEINLQMIPVYGGQSIEQQLRRLKRGVHFVVGTPGRIIDHIKRKTLELSAIKHLILDEADEMLNMGFIEDMEEIMKHTSKDKKTLLFSATMPQKIKELASKYMKGHTFISVKNQTLTTNLTEQIYYEVKASDKFEVLCRIIDIEEKFYGLIFCRTKNDVDSVANHLSDRGYEVSAIHGDIDQSKREKTLQKFRDKKINILVATDVAARGIDVNDLTHVINYALPQDPESYVHRIGRTGRAGKQGTAITFITPSEYNKLLFIQRVSKSSIKKSVIPSVSDIIELKKKKIEESLLKLDSVPLDKTYFNWAKKLVADNEPLEFLGRVLYHFCKTELNPSLYDDKVRNFSGERDLSLGKGRHHENFQMEGCARLFVALGKKDDITPAKLVKFIIDNTGVKNSVIDQVEVYGTFSFITVPFKEAEVILNIFKKLSGDGKSLVVHAKKADEKKTRTDKKTSRPRKKIKSSRFNKKRS